MELICEGWVDPLIPNPELILLINLQYVSNIYLVWVLQISLQQPISQIALLCK